MRFYDIFNGDADGICALHQLRLSEPADATLVTGVKRDISLVERVSAANGDRLTIFDVSLRDNAPAVLRALERGAEVLYFDHHATGDIPSHSGFRSFIDTSPELCTSLIVDRFLGGRQRAWAVVGAFGDNLRGPAARAAEALDLSPDQVYRLRELGEAINYNGYGESVEDLHYHPADLYDVVRRYESPFQFISDEPVFEVLRNASGDDMARAEDLAAHAETSRCAAFVFPEAAWARRVQGVFANRVAQQHPERAHAVLVAKPGGGYTVSVRAPITRPTGAESLCSQFPTGGGRQGAAGINHLPDSDLEGFLRKFTQAY